MGKKFLVVVLVLVAVGSVGFYMATSSRPPGLVLTGIVTTDDVIVSSQIQGRLATLLVKEGDEVKRGALLATIEPRELRADEAFYAHSAESSAAQVDEAEAALKYQELQTRDQINQAQAALDSARAQQAEAAAQLERAGLDAQRTSNLFKQGIVSQAIYDQARTAHDAAQARVESLAKQVEAQQAALALARAAAEQIAIRESELRAGRHQLAAAGAQAERAKVRLGYTEIRSPIDGLVDVRAARQGEVVNPGQPIVTLVNPVDFWVRADVEETYVDRIHRGEAMTVRLPSGVERTGTVFFIGSDAAFATQRDVSRTKRDIKTFEVRLRVDNRDRRLHLGMTAFVVVPAEDVK